MPFRLGETSEKPLAKGEAGEGETKTLNPNERSAMARGSSVEKVKEFLNSQIYDEEKWAVNSKLLCAVGLFAGSIIFMRNFGDLMAI